ncbi:MAG: fatty acid desaturase [Planctomycetota bacterium]
MTTATAPASVTDYSLSDANARRAIERGLAEADWYTCHVPRDEMRRLLERRDGPAIRDTLIWFTLLGVSGWAGYVLWPSWWAIIPFAIYGVIYGTTSDSRWHESSHGTAFKTDWMNNVLYEIASFMVMRESTPWRWSHTRHHSDTIITGRDPEIAVPRPPDFTGLILSFFGVMAMKMYFTRLAMHCVGVMHPDERMYVPESEYGKVFFKARISALIYAAVIATALVSGSILPLMFIGLPNLYGSWLMPMYGLTQHAGLAEDVLDHRLNCRTVYMNWLHRYLYWNMNYHVEHHMFPLVPYHNLPRLHAAVKADMPTPYPSIVAAFREIIPALLRQRREPTWCVHRQLPTPPSRSSPTQYAVSGIPDNAGWLAVGAAAQLARGQVIRCDHGKRTYALYLTDAGAYHATDGICTHGNSHLAEGLVKGRQIECPKHNGRFELSDGSPARAPVCRALRTYQLENRDGTLWLNVAAAGGAGAREQRTLRFRVVSNRLVATFITELVLEPLDGACAFTPGDYLQLDIPNYGRIAFRDLIIPEPFAASWRAQGLLELAASHDGTSRRNNYSIASGPNERGLRFNIRIATPPPGGTIPPGVGSAWVFSLKPGDTVTGIGPFGDFHIKPTQREMVYIGGGAGMAPIRAHLLQLFGQEPTARRVSYWYGARSRRELFYHEDFAAIAARNRNFTFHPALSEPQEGDAWDGPTGFIHEVVREKYLATHANPRAIEFYLCGPPKMIEACTAMLTSFGVDLQMISFDAF